MQESTQKSPTKYSTKGSVFRIIVLQIFLAIPLYTGAFILFPNTKPGGFFETIIAVLLFWASLYLSLLILSKKFDLNNTQDVSLKLASISLALGGAGTVFNILNQNPNTLHDAFIVVLYTLSAYFCTKLFFLRKFRT